MSFKNVFSNYRYVVISILSLWLLSCVSGDGNKRLTVGEGGSLTSIVIPEVADQTTGFAGTELQSYLEKMTGVRLPVKRSSSAERESNAIRIIRKKDSDLKWDGFRIETDRKGIIISAEASRGLLFGVYTLLEEAGCSFVYLGEQEEVVPQQAIVEFNPLSKAYNPLLEHRGLTPYGLVGKNAELGRSFIDWMAKNKFNYILVSEDRPSIAPGDTHASIWKEVEHELLPELQKRGFVIEMSEHCTHVFLPPALLKKHQDWLALNNGERKLKEPPRYGQLCYSNRGAVEYYANAVAEYAAAHPEFSVIGTWPLDGGGYCECEGCKDPLTVFNAAKRVAEKVKVVRPDILVEHLAYKPQTWEPPENDIPGNMSILWCPDNGKMDDLVSKWILSYNTLAILLIFKCYHLW